MTADPDVSVVVCSFNGAARLPDCLQALERQSIRQRMEVLVIDDGSRDATGGVAANFGARLVRHPVNRGIAAARNTGVRAARGRVVMFVDDDVVVAQDWAERLDAALGPDVVAAGGAIDLLVRPGLLAGFVNRHNPLEPLDLSLERDDGVMRRLRAYLRRQWTEPSTGYRAVSAIPTASFACRRADLLESGLFDEALTAGEDHEMCWRATEHFPHRRIVFDPAARATHVTSSSVTSLIRRKQWYGRGSCDLFLGGRVRTPAIFFAPFVMAGLLAASIRRPRLVLIALVLPHVLFPRGARTALSSRTAGAALDPYIEVAGEAAHDFGFVERLAGVMLDRISPTPQTLEKP
jgi:GT2 family glycosyltransferase